MSTDDLTLTQKMKLKYGFNTTTTQSKDDLNLNSLNPILQERTLKHELSIDTPGSAKYTNNSASEVQLETSRTNYDTFTNRALIFDPNNKTNTTSNINKVVDKS
jgi:hypothetical protein